MHSGPTAFLKVLTLIKHVSICRTQSGNLILQCAPMSAGFQRADHMGRAIEEAAVRIAFTIRYLYEVHHRSAPGGAHASCMRHETSAAGLHESVWLGTDSA